MTVTNGYCTTQALAAEVDIPDTSEDARLEVAIAAASRQIDHHCNRRFWQDATVVVREYFADDHCTCVVDDISTTTGLIVKVDSAGDGTFASTLTITTNYLLLPRNADKEVPVRPWTEIRLVDSSVSVFPILPSGRPGVQVTAKFGWPAVPDDVVKATLIQATQLFKASSAAFGGVQLGLDGSVIRLRNSLNPMSVALLEPFVRHDT